MVTHITSPMTNQKREKLIQFKVFVAGAVVMALELLGSRLLAPSFGNSIFVWGALIGVIMVALSMGYWYGGIRADKDPSRDALSNILTISGILILLVPLSSPFILEIVQLSRLGDVYGPLLASLLLLAAPTFLLGMVSPYSVRLSANEVVKMGSVSGNLSGINTAGSIFGTFFTVFVLIPVFGTREIITSLGIITLAVSFLERNWREFLPVIILVAILMVPEVVIGGKMSILGGSVLYSTESPYSSLTVVQNNNAGTRTLYLDDMAHSAMYLNGSVNAVFRYTDFFNLAFAYNPNIRKVLFIGGGGFSGPKQFLTRYPGIVVDVVEIDPDVVQVAYDYFNLPQNETRLKVYNMDGRTFFDNTDSYDLIVLDAYSHTYVPFHLMTQEFFIKLRNHLNPGGVIISNLISSLVGDTSDLLWCEIKTVNSVFPQVYLYPTISGTRSLVQNIILVSQYSYDIKDKTLLSSNLAERIHNPSRVVSYLDNLYMAEPPESSFILNDNYAPVDTLLNPVTKTPFNRSDELIRVSIINPIVLAAFWVLSLGLVYYISIQKKMGS